MKTCDLLPPNPTPTLTTKSVIKTTNLYITVENTLIDSGASACFIDYEFVTKYKINTRKKESPIVVRMIDGREVESGKVTHVTDPVMLVIGEHCEEIAFNVIRSPGYPVILGMPWLKQHNPSIDWRECTLLFRCCHGGDLNDVGHDALLPLGSLGAAGSGIGPASLEPETTLAQTPRSTLKMLSENFITKEDPLTNPNISTRVKGEQWKNYPKGEGKIGVNNSFDESGGDGLWKNSKFKRQPTREASRSTYAVPSSSSSDELNVQKPSPNMATRTTHPAIKDYTKISSTPATKTATLPPVSAPPSAYATSSASESHTVRTPALPPRSANNVKAKPSRSTYAAPSDTSDDSAPSENPEPASAPSRSDFGPAYSESDPLSAISDPAPKKQEARNKDVTLPVYLPSVCPSACPSPKLPISSASTSAPTKAASANPELTTSASNNGAKENTNSFRANPES